MWEGGWAGHGPSQSAGGGSGSRRGAVRVTRYGVKALYGATVEVSLGVGYRNVGSKNSDAGEIPRRIYVRITTR
jgi:hypothetical protein